MKVEAKTEDEFWRGSYTPVDIPLLPRLIEPSGNVYFAGSCFAANLYHFWQDHFLPGRISPFGNIYNPESLKETFALLLSGRTIEEKELFLHKGLWRHSLFDSSGTGADKEELMNSLNTRLRNHRDYLQKCKTAVITLGTAWVYKEDTTGKTVNNCHKRPSAHFRRVCLSYTEIDRILEELCQTLTRALPGIHIIFTLSPVRHLRDNAQDNFLSKALLRCGLDAVCRSQSEADYFPSYEIMLDELRDYRWYADDLTHPSDRAIRYIMKRFCLTAGSPALADYLKEAESLRKKQNHRLQFPDSPEGLQFKEKLRKDRQDFIKAYPFAEIPGYP